MNETIKRRFAQNWTKPDLVLIDGGKGQLHSAILASDGSLPMFGLAEKQELIVVHKSLSNIKISGVKVAESKGLVFEEGEFLLVKLPKETGVIKLLQRIRDEAHRFAVGYHTQLKVQAQTISALDQIKGIGPQTRQKLLKKYKSLAGVARAETSEIEVLIGKSKARLIKEVLNK